ncbi:hypothetical protein Tco_1162474 [Tanacetum coccineum]
MNLVPKELIQVVVPGAKKSWGILLLKLGLRVYLNIPMIHCSQEDASKQGRINVIDADEKITLVSVHDANVYAGEEVFATTVDDITLAQVLEEIKSKKPKKKGIVIQELGESTTTISSQLSSQQSHDKGKIDADHQLVERIAGGRQRKESRNRADTRDYKEAKDEDEVAIDAIPLAIKSPCIVGWKIYKEGRKNYYQIMRADGKSQMYMFFSQMLKSFNKEDLEDLYKLIYMLVEKKYPLAPLTLSMMLEKKLIIDYESEMAYQLLKFIMKQLKK